MILKEIKNIWEDKNNTQWLKIELAAEQWKS